MIIETLSVFPEMFDTVMSTSILGRAKASGLFQFHAYNLRDWTHDRHHTVDDEPYGGGQGMLMKVEPLASHRGYCLHGSSSLCRLLYTVRHPFQPASRRATLA